MRLDAVRQIATQSTGTDSQDQRDRTDQLARQIQIEPDPLIREAIIETISRFRTPLSGQVLTAGLNDTDEAVRLACCRALGARGESASITSLAAVLQKEESIDVRLAAAEALGNIKSPEAVQALVVALDDRDPAMQYVGVQSMRSITGKDYGGNVQAWRQVAAGEVPETPETPSLAERLMPFPLRK